MNGETSNPAISPSSLLREKWTLVSSVVIALLYAYLIQLHPSGEGWGRGWNTVAFLLYASPTAWLAAGVALWRTSRTAGSVKKLGVAAAVLGLVFPLVAFIVIRARA